MGAHALISASCDLYEIEASLVYIEICMIARDLYESLFQTKKQKENWSPISQYKWNNNDDEPGSLGF